MTDTGGVVLVVDDDPDIREGLELLLGRHGYAVVTVADGDEALAWLRQGDRAALILLDLMMPAMNGIELEGILRRHQAWSGIPIVIITGAGARVADRIVQMNLDVLPKPFDVPALLALVKRHYGAPIPPPSAPPAPQFQM